MDVENERRGGGRETSLRPGAGPLSPFPLLSHRCIYEYERRAEERLGSDQARVDCRSVEACEGRGLDPGDAGRHGGAERARVGAGGGEAVQDELDVLHHLLGAKEAVDCKHAARTGPSQSRDGGGAGRRARSGRTGGVVYQMTRQLSRKLQPQQARSLAG
jgi:hypothetical protein